MEKTQLLLSSAGALVQESQAKQAASGEAFNLFTITKIERVEVNTHSAMLAEILNPRGRHGKGPLFLGLFLSHMGIEHEPRLAEARVRKEETFAAVQGRVDIVIHLPNRIILIENKVDAEDGDEQLKRYAHVGQTSGKRWDLLYLTLLGTDADVSSCRGVAYRRVSYREHILDWLEKCVAAAADTSALQHALIQYANIVRKITGTSMTQNTKRALIQLISAGNDFESADAIAEALPFAKGATLQRFFDSVDRSLSQTYTRAHPPAGFPGLEFNEEICCAWFRFKGLRPKNVGMFHDIGVEGALLRIEVATDALHYGLVPVSNGKLGCIEQLREFAHPIPEHLIYRDWRAFKWVSSVYEENVGRNMDRLLATDQLLEQVFETIKQLTKAPSDQV
jgi:hypothetical protein